MTDELIDRIPRRRTYHVGGRPVRLSVTLTEQERRQLGELAAARGVSIATLLVDSALRSPWPPTDKQPRQRSGCLRGVEGDLRLLGAAGRPQD